MTLNSEKEEESFPNRGKARDSRRLRARAQFHEYPRNEIRNSYKTHAAYLLVVQRWQERKCASSEKSEFSDSFIRLTLLAELEDHRTMRWPFDNLGNSTKSEIPVLSRRAALRAAHNGSNETP